jgi:hypothetical protein
MISNLSFSAFSEPIEKTEHVLFFNSNLLELHSTRKALPLSGLLYATKTSGNLGNLQME